MFGKTWKISESKYKVIVERDVKIKMSDGAEINADIFRPDSDEKFPAIFGYHPYDQEAQTAPIKPSSFSTFFFRNPGQEKGNAYIEAGDPDAFVRRGYVYVIANIRGTGKSGGKYPFLAPPEAQDGFEIIEWIARQPWCNGNVGMFGVSYFAWIQLFIAALNPPHLKCFFAPWGATDLYRDSVYRGGILGHGFWRMWVAGSIPNCRLETTPHKQEGINKLLQDEDIAGVPEIVQILKNHVVGANPLFVDILLHPYDGPYWEKRKVKYEGIKVPGYIGACWGIYGLHLPGAFRSWENLKVPKKMLIGPPAYLDRPLYQLQYESLRWFDYWLKGIDTGIMKEAPIKLFIMGTNEWKEANEWPLPETKWTPFYLHKNGILHERVCHINEGFDSFEDSPWGRGYLEYCSPRLVENTEVIGPIVLNLYASTTDDEVLWFVSLREVDSQGNERVLTRGWLRGTHREIDPKRSKPWEPFHPHTKLEPLIPNKIYEFNIPIVPTGNLFKAGSIIKLKISCTDDQPKNPLEMLACGNLYRQSPSRITVYHDPDYPSCLLLPITKGNVLETFLSEGKPYL
jgi:predicted acyl esterase